MYLRRRIGGNGIGITIYTFINAHGQSGAKRSVNGRKNPPLLLFIAVSISVFLIFIPSAFHAASLCLGVK